MYLIYPLGIQDSPKRIIYSFELENASIEKTPAPVVRVEISKEESILVRIINVSLLSDKNGNEKTDFKILKASHKGCFIKDNFEEKTLITWLEFVNKQMGKALYTITVPIVYDPYLQNIGDKLFRILCINNKYYLNGLNSYITTEHEIFLKDPQVIWILNFQMLKQL